jgi:hypothetical protein
MIARRAIIENPPDPPPSNQIKDHRFTQITELELENTMSKTNLKGSAPKEQNFNSEKSEHAIFLKKPLCVVGHQSSVTNPSDTRKEVDISKGCRDTYVLTEPRKFNGAMMLERICVF